MFMIIFTYLSFDPLSSPTIKDIVTLIVDNDFKKILINKKFNFLNQQHINRYTKTALINNFDRNHRSNKQHRVLIGT